MLNLPTPFQLRAKHEVAILTASRGFALHWAEEPGELYVGELIVVGRVADEALTVWLYDDAIDYCLKKSETVNFEAESFPNEESLLKSALEHLGKVIPHNAPRA